MKTFSYRNSELEKPKVLLLAPTGVAAINVDGAIHSALHIPVKSEGLTHHVIVKKCGPGFIKTLGYTNHRVLRV